MNRIKWFQAGFPITICAFLLSIGGCGDTKTQDSQSQTADSVSQDAYSHLPVYTGTDLGSIYHDGKTDFNIWAPTASEVILRLYETGTGDSSTDEFVLIKADDGTWSTQIAENLEGTYYTFQVKSGDQWLKEVAGPYARTTGVNGERAMVVNLKSLEPEGWENDKGVRPVNFADIILYEMHVRDFTVDENSGIKNKGKFLGIGEANTRNPQGRSTGMAHLKDLGITHVHLLPSFDHQSIDESKLNEQQYNWGYDPMNYNVPEGSYSTKPSDGHVRIKEFRKMVQNLHQNGIGVVLDVVYNHTGSTEGSIFNQIEPGYYYRHNPDGSFSDASGCGNETASERAMMRKYIVESVVYWATQYHIDGFRFDLMGIHDIETMNAVRKALDQVDPKIFIYGEGWTAGGSPLAEDLRAVKRNTYQMPGIAAFCDEMRDAIKGHWSDKMDRGFATGKKGMIESIMFGIVGAGEHPQIDLSKVNYSQKAWTQSPTQCINYVDCHDDLCLRDKIEVSAPDQEQKPRVQRLALAMVLTAQGVPFLHSGSELFRTKQHDHNSYKSSDEINKIRWEWKNEPENLAVFNYVKSMIQLRKDHPAFRMGTQEAIQKHLSFVSQEDSLQLAYRITGAPRGEKWPEILVLINGNDHEGSFKLPEGDWKIGADEKGYDPNGMKKAAETYVSPPKTLSVLFQTN